MRDGSILICTYSAGCGHHMVAQAIREALMADNRQIRVHISDLFGVCLPRTSMLMNWLYLRSILYTPGIYRRFYERAERAEGTWNPVFDFLINREAAGEIDRVLEDLKPSLVICVHPFPAALLYRYKRLKGADGPAIIGVITDFTVHPIWASLKLDGYFLSTPDIYQALVDKGIPPDRLWAVGIPLRGDFSLGTGRSEVKKELGIRPGMKTIVIMGGGLGLGDLEEAVVALGKSGIDAQLAVISGANKALQNRLVPLTNRVPKPLKVFGYTNVISGLMDAADLLVTKPGGVTIAEALARELPVLIWKPLPGQEERNTSFLLSRGLARRAFDSRELVQYSREMLGESSEAYHRPCPENACLHRTAAWRMASIIRTAYIT